MTFKPAPSNSSRTREFVVFTKTKTVSSRSNFAKIATRLNGYTPFVSQCSAINAIFLLFKINPILSRFYINYGNNDESMYKNEIHNIVREKVHIQMKVVKMMGMRSA